jgi:putative flippase GtrA
MTDLSRQAQRFLLVGGANTGVTIAIFTLLARVMDPSLAYTIVFLLGLVFTTMMTSRFVFSTTAPPGRMAMFVAWYLAVYGVGLLVVRLLDRGQHWPKLGIAVVTVMVTAPLSFIGGRLIFHQDSNQLRNKESTG